MLEELVVVMPLDQASSYESNGEVENHEYSSEGIASPAGIRRRTLELKPIIPPII